MGSGTGFLHAARRGLTRDAKLLLVSFSLTGLSIGLLNVSLSVYMQRLGLTAVHAGTFFTTTGLTSVSLVIPFGILADRYGRRRMTILGTALMAAALGMLVLADSYGMFLLAGGLLGVAEALGFSTFNALLAEATDPAVRTSVFGMSFFFNSMGFAAGNLLGILPDVLYAANPADPTGAYRPAFAIAAGLSLASPLALLLVRVGRTRAPEGRSLLPRKSARILTRFFASNFIIGLGAGLIIPLFTLWFYLKFGLAESTTGPLLALASVFMAFSYLLAPVLSRRRGMVRSIVEVQALATATLFFIPLVLNIHVVGALYIAAEPPDEHDVARRLRVPHVRGRRVGAGRGLRGHRRRVPSALRDLDDRGGLPPDRERGPALLRDDGPVRGRRPHVLGLLPRV